MLFERKNVNVVVFCHCTYVNMCTYTTQVVILIYIVTLLYIYVYTIETESSFLRSLSFKVKYHTFKLYSVIEYWLTAVLVVRFFPSVYLDT